MLHFALVFSENSLKKQIKMKHNKGKLAKPAKKLEKILKKVLTKREIGCILANVNSKGAVRVVLTALSLFFTYALFNCLILLSGGGVCG